MISVTHDFPYSCNLSFRDVPHSSVDIERPKKLFFKTSVIHFEMFKTVNSPPHETGWGGGCKKP